MLHSKSNISYIFWVWACSLITPAYLAHVCSSVPYFSALCNKRRDFENLFNIKCFLDFLYNFCLKDSKKKWGRCDKNVYCSSGKVLVIFVRLQWNLSLLDIVSRNIRIPNFMKIHLLVEEFFHADGQMNMAKLMLAFCNLANALKKTKQNNSTRN